MKQLLKLLLPDFMLDCKKNVSTYTSGSQAVSSMISVHLCLCVCMSKRKMT